MTDIEQLDEAGFDLNPNKRGNRTRLQTYRCLKERYVDTWRSQGANYFKIKRADVSFGKLSVTVDPEVGMRTLTADRALKLWFYEREVTTKIIGVCSYLLWEAAAYADWPRPWRPGTWDVYRSRLMDADPRPGHLEEWIHQCAAEFVALSAPARN